MSTLVSTRNGQIEIARGRLRLAQQELAESEQAGDDERAHRAGMRLAEASERLRCLQEETLS